MSIDNNQKISTALTLCATELKLNNPSLRDTTLKNYKNLLSKILEGSLSIGLDITEIHCNLPKCFLFESKSIIQVINETKWHKEYKPLSERTRKNYYAVLLSLTRGIAIDENSAYYLKDYNYEFELLNESIKSIELQQIPRPKELQLKNLTIDKLLKLLSYHRDKTDLDSILLELVGAINCCLCLRNEPASMLISKDYLNQDEQQYKRTNFIWNKGRNKKYLYIRYNKVRTEKDPQREIPITGYLNTVLNRYLKEYENFNDDDIKPLLFKTRGMNSPDKSVMSEPNYCNLVKRVWRHLDLDLSSTLIRKVYAMDIRRKYGGKLTEEMKACIKLDHSKSVHDSNYIIFYD